jgi:hypothetical protein
MCYPVVIHYPRKSADYFRGKNEGSDPPGRKEIPGAFILLTERVAFLNTLKRRILDD